jgi:hypothetical protein
MTWDRRAWDHPETAISENYVASPQEEIYRSPLSPFHLNLRAGARSREVGLGHKGQEKR